MAFADLKKQLQEDIRQQLEALSGAKASAAAGGSAAGIDPLMKNLNLTADSLKTLNDLLGDTNDAVEKQKQEASLLTRTFKTAKKEVGDFASGVFAAIPRSGAGLAGSVMNAGTGLQSTLAGSFKLVAIELATHLIPAILHTARTLQDFAHNLRTKGLGSAVGELPMGVKVGGAAYLGYRMGGVKGAVAGGLWTGMFEMGRQGAQQRLSAQQAKYNTSEEAGVIARENAARHTKAMRDAWAGGKGAKTAGGKGLEQAGRHELDLLFKNHILKRRGMTEDMRARAEGLVKQGRADEYGEFYESHSKRADPAALARARAKDRAERGQWAGGGWFGPGSGPGGAKGGTPEDGKAGGLIGRMLAQAAGGIAPGAHTGVIGGLMGASGTGAAAGGAGAKGGTSGKGRKTLLDANPPGYHASFQAFGDVGRNMQLAALNTSPLQAELQKRELAFLERMVKAAESIDAKTNGAGLPPRKD